ncbi:MAG: type III-A CRISPR-associated protein Csm2 [Euryarchaeota archaeon]|nr:type III-A CRISPR-associated protein Csm2 [Euryarchaeota archaeon]
MLKEDYAAEIRSLERKIEELADLRKEKRYREAKELERRQFQEINKLIEERIIPNLPENMRAIDYSQFVDDTQVLSYLALALNGKAGKDLDLKTAQLRKFFDSLKSIEQKVVIEKRNWNEVKADFVLLTPKLAYTKGKNLIPQPFYLLLRSCLQRVNSKEDLKALIRIFETIVAYHKYHGGKD